MQKQMSKGRSIKDKIVLAILITIFAVFALGILYYLGFAVMWGFYGVGYELSFLPSKSIQQAFPEYDLSYDDVEYIEYGQRIGFNEYYWQRMSDEDAKAYLENFSEVKVNFR